MTDEIRMIEIKTLKVQFLNGVEGLDMTWRWCHLSA
jgi:hypothetical protein